MKAVVIEERELYVRNRPDPIPGSTELLVEVRAAGINSADLMQRRGVYPAPPGAPADIPGLELAGIVTRIGNQVTKFALGDRVMGVVAGGGQATTACIDEDHAYAVPDSLSWEEAGGFPEAYSTAFDALFTQCQLSIGERVLVTGAAGGVGTACVQLAATTGAFVVAAVRDPNLRDRVAALGAERVVDPDDVARNGPYDVVVELVGSSSLGVALAALAPNARVSVVGVGSGSKLEVNLLDLMGRRARVSGSTLRARTRAEKAYLARQVEARVVSLLAAGRVTVPVCQVFSIERVRDAYERFSEGSKLGKIVLVPVLVPGGATGAVSGGATGGVSG
ncbi:MAG: zinc-binding dehydrogenase [Actinobacteria bacterium]|nr:zinc-binding dehydrogenase [Actinomycetota bacterium]